MAQHNPKRLVSVAFVVVLVLAVGGVISYWYLTNKSIAEIESANASLSAEAMKRSLRMEYTKHELNKRYSDADNDLVADTPKDASQQIDPETLTISYVGGDPSGSEKTWQDLIEHLKKATGKNVAYLPAANIDEQLWQLQQGKLHMTVVNSGAVPLAVNACGFVPAYTMGKSGYKMKIIVPKDSPINKVEQIRILTLADTKSNSGYKLPLLVMKEKGLTPEVDYTIYFSMGQKKSIAGIAEKRFEAAAVASDLLQREESAGTIKPEDYRVIYTSPEYPQAAVGFAYNLNPELAKKLRAAMESFDWNGSTLNKEFAAGGQGKFVPTSYLKDWEQIRFVADSFRTEDRIIGPVPAAPATTTAPATQGK